MGYIGEKSTQTGLLKIIERLPYHLRSRWVKVYRKIRKSEDRVPDIDDVAEFVEGVTEEANDPVYRILNKIGDEPGQRSGSGNKTKHVRGNFSVNAKGEATKKCIVCEGNHTLFGCFTFNPYERLVLQKRKGCALTV